MKDPSRPPHTSPSLRSAPYRKRKSDGAISPARPTRRSDGASSRFQDRMASPCPLARPPGSHRDEAKPVCAQSPADDDANEARRSLSATGGNRAIPRRQDSLDDGSMPAQASAAAAGLSIVHADVRGPSLRLPLTVASAPPTVTAFSVSTPTARAPSPSSTGSEVTNFLRSIELPPKPASAPAPQTSFAHPSLRLPPLSTVTGSTTQNAKPPAANSTNGKGHQVALVYKGYPFTYDLSTLPDDPKGVITLLTITESDPGPYLLIGAHYRRTGRPGAARTVIRSLLDSLESPSDIGLKPKGDAVSVPPSDTFVATLVCPGSPRSKPIERTAPEFKGAAVRPAMLLLAACEMDISRERPDDPESASHVFKAHDLYRAVYGTVNDAIVAGAIRPQPENTLGLDLPGSQNRSTSDMNGHTPSGVLPRREVVESQARVKNLEKELSASRASQKKLQEKLTMSNDRLVRAEDKEHVLESRCRDMIVRLDESRGENRELRQQLAQAEERARDLAQWAPNAETRVWERLKDFLFDNLDGGMRGEQ